MFRKTREAIDASLAKAEQTVNKAGGVVTATAVLAGVALIVAVVALVIAARK
jgi:hypothetical protein